MVGEFAKSQILVYLYNRRLSTLSILLLFIEEPYEGKLHVRFSEGFQPGGEESTSIRAVLASKFRKELSYSNHD